MEPGSSHCDGSGALAMPTTRCHRTYVRILMFGPYAYPARVRDSLAPLSRRRGRASCPSMAGPGRTPRSRPQDHRRVRPWVPDDLQWQRFLEIVRKEPLRTRLMTLLAYEGALRRETLVGLEVGDVDLPNRLITIRPEIVKGGKGNVVVFSAPTANAYARYLPELKAVATRSRRMSNRLFRS